MEGDVIGTSSLRRRAQVLAWNRGLGVRDLRGNVGTRLRKLAAGDVDAVLLAAAGLRRLDLWPNGAEFVDPNVLLPAPGQGALAVQARAGDAATLSSLGPLEHPRSRAAFEAERELVRRLGGGCALPIGALAAVSGDTIRMRALVASPDGSTVVQTGVQASTPAGAAEAAARDLLDDGAAAVLDALGREG
jgi:hydroxymethylbilane synthase